MRRCPKCNSFFDDSVDACLYDGEGLIDVQVEAVQDETLEGQTISDRYQVREPIGEGGMGMVYKALDDRTGELIALKVLHRDISGDERTVRRFFSEARVLQSLAHPNIIRFTDFGKTDDGQLFIAMECLEGSPADELMKDEGLALKDAISVVDQTAAALAEAHLQGVIHRDLKPANLFITRNEQGEVHVTVLDFGIAKIAGSGQNLTATGKVMGTPSYMAPEQIRGQEPDPRTDVYALGAMAYELISGEPPFVADGPIAVLFMHLEKTPDPLHKMSLPAPVSPKLSAVIETLLAKEPSNRPANMLEVRKLLGPFLGRQDDLDGVDLDLLDTQMVDANTARTLARASSAAAATTSMPQMSGTGPVVIGTNHAISELETELLPTDTPLPRPPIAVEEEATPWSWWLGAALIALLLAGIVAMGIFLVATNASVEEGPKAAPAKGSTAP
jgi:eukaryotic-like serine/threonine-protein kinase